MIKNRKAYLKKYNEINKEKIKEYKKEYIIENKETIKSYGKEYRKKNKQKRQNYVELNKKQIKQYQKNYRQINKKEIRAKKQIYQQVNKEQIRATKKRYRELNKEKINAKHKDYYLKNKSKFQAQNKLYRQSNKAKIKAHLDTNREVINTRERNRKQNDILFNLSCKLRNRIRKFAKVHNYQKNKTTEEMLGCTYQEFKEHFQSKFTSTMSWELFIKGNIHIDHKIPLITAKTEGEVYKLCHYSNLQPLWAEENLQKGGREEAAFTV